MPVFKKPSMTQNWDQILDVASF